MSETYRVTGLMSGSSLDGVDLACCEFRRKMDHWEYTVLKASTIPYPIHLLNYLKEATTWEMEQIIQLDHELGVFFAGLLNEFHRSSRLSPELISSHGHTILHNPDKKITYQAGNGKVMADITMTTVVNDFRSADVQQGGQGAPLVPVGDRLLFGEFGACLNLGGFANISFENEHLERVAYDIGPANLALNWIAELEGLAFDRDGLQASKGSVDTALLEQLNSLDYYRMKPPKSLGKEWFSEIFLPAIRDTGLGIPDLMATVTEHIAMQLSSAVESSLANRVLVTGGGALNLFLMERLKDHSRAHIRVPDIQLVQYKEALIFALLGLLRTLGETNCLSSVTGGRADLSTGMIHNPITL